MGIGIGDWAFLWDSVRTWDRVGTDLGLGDICCRLQVEIYYGHYFKTYTISIDILFEKRSFDILFGVSAVCIRNQIDKRVDESDMDREVTPNFAC